MGAIYILEGLLIYLYAFDHNPPHIYVRSGSERFTITIRDRVVEGRAKSKSIVMVNEFLDTHESEVMELWERLNEAKQ